MINICIQTDLVYFNPLVVYLPSLIFSLDRPARAVNVMGSHFVFKSISAYETKMAALLWSREYRCVHNIAGKLRYNFSPYSLKIVLRL